MEELDTLIFMTFILLLSSVESRKSYLVETAEDQFEVEVDVENWADEVSHDDDGDAGDDSITTVKSVKGKSF